MTDPIDDELEQRLRDALRAEAGAVQPSPAALDRIRARTERARPFWLGGFWLRPSLAVGAAALIVGSVLLGTPQLREQVLPDSLTTASEDDAQSPGSGPANAGDHLEEPSATDDDPDRPAGPRTSPTPEAESGDPLSGTGATPMCLGPAPSPTAERSPSASPDLDAEDEEAPAGPGCVPSPQPSSPDDDGAGDGDPSGEHPGGDGEETEPGGGTTTPAPDAPDDPSAPPAEGSDTASGPTAPVH
ncbi:hypothetical protein [Marinactinospora rubrisoli]|uniref:DUF3040 domain-containing protein n=1 Tax=Marinactinospora rubrisoli TaxID=2715399 RepID=A0ABW2KKA0_9ACTN